jgi:hypothetical protein
MQAMGCASTLAAARRIHGREVRVRDNDLVAEGLDLMLAGHPFAVGRGVDPAFPLVHVDAHLVHGWLVSLPSAELTAGCSCAALCHHVKRETSRFIPSTLRPLKAKTTPRTVAGVERVGGRSGV